jgi:hypothetical protein
MKKKMLLATVAIATTVGLASMAAAQAPAGSEMNKGGAAAPAAAPHEGGAPGGAMKPSGAQPMQKSGSPAGQSAQGTPPGAPKGDTGAKPDDRMGQNGTHDDHAIPGKGAQDERNTPRNAEDTGKTGRNASEQNASKSGTARGTDVKLTQDQRSRVMSAIGRGGSRATTDVKFDVSVGARVPRNVHIVVIPEDVVEIVPQYEGFDYVMVGDEILIIDPESLEIVAVIEA